MPAGLAVLLLALAGQAGPPPSITVSAAASLSEVMDALAEAYAKDGGGAVRFNLAGSNVLARQIVNGAPVDLFISADEAQMDAAAKAGAIVSESRRPFASNQLAVVTTPDRAGEIRDTFQRGAPGVRRLAVGDPGAVPAGVYARAYLTRKGLWDAYEKRLVPMSNVRAALAAVESGNADAAIVYATDARASKAAVVALLVPIEEAPPIVYPAAIVAGTRQRAEAERFLRFLHTPAARAILSRYGFLPPPGA